MLTTEHSHMSLHDIDWDTDTTDIPSTDIQPTLEVMQHTYIVE